MNFDNEEIIMMNTKIGKFMAKLQTEMGNKYVQKCFKRGLSSCRDGNLFLSR